MKKKVFAAVLSLALLLCAVPTAFAETNSAEWDVTFTSENTLDSNYTAANLSSKVHEMQPGDTVNLTLNLRNDNGAPANWYMSNTVLQSLEESGNAANGGAYEYELTYANPDNGVDVLFTSDAVGGELSASDRVGLKNATEALEDYFYLDTLEPGERAVVNLRVSLDGETQGNSYQDTLARLQLNFAVDPTTERTEIVTRPGLPVVQTGDHNDSLPFIIAAGASGLLLLVLALLGTRERKNRNKNVRRMMCLLLAGMLACATPALSFTARAAEDPLPLDPSLRYTVRLYPGAQGSIDVNKIVSVHPGDGRAAYRVEMQDGVCVLSDLPYGAIVTFHTDEETEGGVVLNGTENADSKYYIRGVRESGQDNSSVSQTAFSVTGDQDYVVAYGIRGEMVAYTIRFEDENGNELAPALVRHGNIGDKPVVAYQYIEGYRPQAYNLTKTLSPNAEENVFTFTYRPIDVNTIIQTVVTPTPGVPETPPAPPAPTPTPPDEPIPEPPTPLTPEAPEEVIDLDDTPLAPGIDGPMGEIINDFATALTGFSTPVRVGLSVGAIALGALLILLFVRKKRKKKDAKAS